MKDIMLKVLSRR